MKGTSNLEAADVLSKYVNDQYGKLCRHDAQQTTKQTSRYRCRYETNGIAFLKIAPLKLEEYYQDPNIVLFHDALYDAEIEYLKIAAKPKVI